MGGINKVSRGVGFADSEDSLVAQREATREHWQRTLVNDDWVRPVVFLSASLPQPKQQSRFS